jgi:hypothetical protein
MAGLVRPSTSLFDGLKFVDTRHEARHDDPSLIFVPPAIG